MKTHRVIGYGAVLLAFALLPLGVFAQCSMSGMSHGGQESKHESPAPKRKLSKQVRSVLDNDERRAELMDAVTEDEDFMREVVERIAASPKWRALMRERLASAPADLDTTDEPAGEPDTPEHMHQH